MLSMFDARKKFQLRHWKCLIVARRRWKAFLTKSSVHFFASRRTSECTRTLTALFYAF